jgi:hypothetical protein
MNGSPRPPVAGTTVGTVTDSRAGGDFGTCVESTDDDDVEPDEHAIAIIPTINAAMTTAARFRTLIGSPLKLRRA